MKKWVQGNPQGFATKQATQPTSLDARDKPKSKGADEINLKHVVIPEFEKRKDMHTIKMRCTPFYSHGATYMSLEAHHIHHLSRACETKGVYGQEE